VDSVVLLGLARRHFLNGLYMSLMNPCADLLPGSHQYLLTAANAFWPVGLVIANGVRVMHDTYSYPSLMIS